MRTKTHARRAGPSKRGSRTVAAGRTARAPADPLSTLQQQAGNGAVAALVARQVGDATGTKQRTLRFGDQGFDVRRLQSRLNANAGVKLALDADGIFGPLTQKAVKQFQTTHPPLDVDGVVGSNTWASLDDAKDEPIEDEDAARKVFQRGADAYARDDFAHAYDFFTRAGELSPHSEITFNRAQCLRRLGGHREEAIALFEEYVAAGGKRSAEAEAFVVELRGPGSTGDADVDEQNARKHFDEAAKLYAGKQFGRAYDEFSIADEAFHKPQITFDRAQCLRRIGVRRDEAIALYQQYLDEEPSGNRADDARANIAELQPSKSGDDAVDTQAAKDAFEKAAALFAEGNYGPAYDQFTKADELSHHTQIVFNRAQCLRKLGANRELAMALFQQYLDEDPGGTRADEARFHLDELRSQGAEAK